jgi:hypothetical protein
MKLFSTALAVLFSYVLIDLNLFRKRNNSRYTAQSVSLEKDIYRKKHKKLKRGYKNRKYKRKRKYIEKTYKYKNSRPLDSRFSNQRKLRRMFRNL